MNFRQRTPPIWLLVAFFSFASESPARALESLLSVGGRKVGIDLIAEKPNFMLGEPATVLFTLHNYSGAALYVVDGGDYQNRLGRADSFKVTVRGTDGTTVPQPEAGAGFGGISGLREIPAKGSYAFRLFLPHWALFQAPGTYSITARRTLQFTAGKGRIPPRKEMIEVDAQADTSIKVVPLDSAEMGKIIDSLGNSLLSGHNDRWPDSSAVQLASIQDERVIPWFAKAFATRDYERKFAALSALAKFKQVDAFNILKMGMDTKGEDMEGATTPKVADQAADNIRHAAAVGLSRSPFPGAKAFLISRRNDPYMGVRITILHVLGKMPPNEALPILKEMSNDQDFRVSNEAKRYVDLLTVKN